MEVAFLGAFTLSRTLTIKEAHFLLDTAEQPASQVEGAPDIGLLSYLGWAPDVNLKKIRWADDEDRAMYKGWEEWLRWTVNYLIGQGIQITGKIIYYYEDGTCGEMTVMNDLVVTPYSVAGEPLTMETLGTIALNVAVAE